MSADPDMDTGPGDGGYGHTGAASPVNAPDVRLKAAPGEPPARAVVAALGAGRMGRGIATAFAWAGHEVRLIDIKPRAPRDGALLAQDAIGEIDAALAAMSAHGVFDDALRARIVARVRFVAREDAAEALADADFIFEGVPETIDAKRDALAFIGAHARADAVVASTTSTILVTELAELIARPQRFLNAHWLNPAWVVPLVELSAHEGTSPQAIDALRALLESIGKVPVQCAASPGFIVPRLQSLIMNEAARMIEQGVASASEIDRATRYGLGFRFAGIGVVEFIDYGGNDILYHASRYLARALGDERYASPAIVDHHMREGRNGLRDGQGFYDFASMDIPDYRAQTLGRMLDLLQHLGLARPPVTEDVDPNAATILSRPDHRSRIDRGNSNRDKWHSNLDPSVNSAPSIPEEANR